MTKKQQTPKISEAAEDFYYDHPLIAVATASTVGALSLIGVLAGVNNCLQPQHWKDAVAQAVQADGFAGIEHPFLPDVFDYGMARTTVMYEDCVIEGVRLSLVYQNNKLTDVTKYDFSTADRAIEAGVLPKSIGSIANASELEGQISLQACLG